MKLFMSILLALLLLSCSGGGEAAKPEPIGTALISWQLPTTYTDGTPLDPSDISVIVVYETAPVRQIVALSGTTIQYTVTRLKKGKHCWFLTAIVQDVESEPSSSECKKI